MPRENRFTQLRERNLKDNYNNENKSQTLTDRIVAGLENEEANEIPSFNTVPMGPIEKPADKEPDKKKTSAVKKEKTSVATKKNGEPKKKTGRKKVKKGEYIRVTFELSKEIHDAMNDILPAFESNATLYLTNLVVKDLNKNYGEYINQIKNKPAVLQIKR